MPLEGTISVPVAGKVKKSTAAVGGLLIAAVLGVLWWRQHKAAQAAAGTSPAGIPGQSGTIDPATGFPYGSPQDQAALSGQAGTGGFVPVGFTGTQAPGPAGGSNPPGPGTFTTNADWAQYAEEYLTGTVGLHAATVGDAIGKYLTGRPLIPNQVQVTEQAIAFAGLPPVAGPGGHPPGFVTAQPPPKPKPKRPTKTITSDGTDTLGKIAAENDVTENELAKWNPALARFVGTGKPVPRGLKVRV